MGRRGWGSIGNYLLSAQCLRTRHAQQVSNIHVRAGGVRHTVLVQVRARARVRAGFSKRLRCKSYRRHQTLRAVEAPLNACSASDVTTT